MLNALGILSMKDCVEILFFSSIIYAFSRWLIADATKHLLPYFYLYLTTLFVAHAWSLSTISLTLLITAPGVLALFALMHQHTLQKNLISLKSLTSKAVSSDNDWVSHLVQTVLHQLNQKKDVLCIIEKSDNLEPFLHTPLIIDAPLSHNLIRFLLQSPSYDAHAPLWLTQNGLIRGINSAWKHNNQTPHMHLYEITTQYTTHNDALFFHASAEHHTVTLIKQGTLEKNISINHLHAILRHHTKKETLSLQKGNHEYHKNNRSQQNTLS